MNIPQLLLVILMVDLILSEAESNTRNGIEDVPDKELIESMLQDPRRRLLRLRRPSPCKYKRKKSCRYFKKIRLCFYTTVKKCL